jgi:glutathione S-transferase
MPPLFLLLFLLLLQRLSVLLRQLLSLLLVLLFQLLLSVIAPVARRLVHAAYKITPDSAQRSLDRVQGVFRYVEEQLSDGRRFLTGERFTAADLTFAALAAPVLLPGECRAVQPAINDLPPAMREDVLRLRNTVAGQFALRLFSQERDGLSATPDSQVP